MEITRDLPKPIPGYPVCYWGVVESGVGAPVVIECWKVSKIPIRIQKPKYALSSSLVIFSQVAYFSSPITCLAYRLLCSTIMSIKDGVNMRSKTSEAFSGTGTVGPTDKLKSLMVSEVRLVDQSAGSVGIGIFC